MTKALMLQGTGSNVGKSMLVAGLCRAYANRGLRVRPFKPQNMSNNAAVTADGGEIGRAQALQALACRVESSVHMNPVLLKPETEQGAQVILQGQRLTHASARGYASLKPTLMAGVLDSFSRLRADADLVLIEGAGSPAEVNLRAGDIANMGFAEAADLPVVLIGDIDRGGVIAQIVGTKAVIAPGDAARIRGFLVNKFRGDVSLFDDGYALIERQTGWRGFGTVPWFPDAHKLPAEDASDIRSGSDGDGLTIAVPLLSRIANFDDFDPLKLEPGIRVVMVPAGHPLPVADLVILAGTKSTRGDLAYMREQGWDIDLMAHHRRGGRILGICGGYQMLGKSIADPEGIEGAPGTSPGLGLLDVETVMRPRKHLTRVSGTDRHGNPVSGYEIHIGETDGPDRQRPLFTIEGRAEGASSPDGQVTGAYLHGLFTSDTYRRAFVEELGAPASDTNYSAGVDATLDALADHLARVIDLDALLSVASGADTGQNRA
ncbi:cobyric acid synthase [Rhodobacteraceae bacterium NNCM2]|nr:cobyric acid synthase [Coraliihabitans acroporae]